MSNEKLALIIKILKNAEDILIVMGEGIDYLEKSYLKREMTFIQNQIKISYEALEETE